MLPPAPALFSTTTACPMFSESFFAMMRAAVSVPPPGAKPTVSVTGRVGKLACAAASHGTRASAAPRPRRNTEVMGSFLGLVTIMYLDGPGLLPNVRPGGPRRRQRGALRG